MQPPKILGISLPQIKTILPCFSSQEESKNIYQNEIKEKEKQINEANYIEGQDDKNDDKQRDQLSQDLTTLPRLKEALYGRQILGPKTCFESEFDSDFNPFINKAPSTYIRTQEELSDEQIR